MLGPRTRHGLVTSEIQRIIILQLQQLGDSIVFTPTLRAIREAYPEAEIDLLCSPVSFQLYRKCTHVNRRFLDSGSLGSARDWIKRLRLLWVLRQRRYDLAIADATEISARYALIAYATGARMRLGFDVANRGFLYSLPLERPEGLDFVRCNLLLARSLGAAPNSSRVECFFDEADVAHAQALLHGLADERPLIAIHPASNWQSKTWLPERWAAVADALSSDHNASIVFVGTRAEDRYVDAIMALMRTSPIKLVGKTDLPQLCAVLSRCDLFLGTDSGPRHVAAAAGTPQITLMSSQDRPERWSFDRLEERIIRTDPACSPCYQSWCSHRTCMTAITEARVLGEARGMLSFLRNRAGDNGPVLRQA
ncbi:MAG: glycosyltransferase family 9 protein [Gemmatimonadaceae bacterium]